MSGLLFFSRLELTNLYGRLDKFLSEDYKLYHLAYSNHEFKILRENYGLTDVHNFQNMVASIFKEQKFDMSIIDEIDALFIKASKGRFCLNAAIRYDRSFKYLSYQECLLLAQCYYTFWKDYLEKYPVKAIFHEPPAMFITHLLCNIAKVKNILFLSQSQVIGQNPFNWIMIEGDNGSPVEMLHRLESDKLAEDNFLDSVNFVNEFRSKSSILFSQYSRSHKRETVAHFPSQLIRISLRHIVSKYKTRKQDQSIVDHLECMSEKGKPGYFEELHNYWYYNHVLGYDAFDKEKIYYFYPLHAEPEASVLYKGDGIYEGQVKLIENLAEQLPPNCYLYVKDHPHRPAFADMASYKRLKTIPNVKIIDPTIPGTEIIRNAKGVITISGTAGFEALLLNKQVYVFGHPFYKLSPRVIYIENIRDFRRIVYNNFDAQYADSVDLFTFVSLFLKSSHKGFISYFPKIVVKYDINHEINAKDVAEGFRRVLSYLNI